MHRLWAELQSIHLTQLPPNLAAVPSSTLPLMTVDLVGLGLRAYRDSGKVWMGLGLGLLLLPDCIRSLTSTISNAKRQMRLGHVMQTPATRSTWRNEFHQWAGGRGYAFVWMSDKVSTANGSSSPHSILARRHHNLNFTSHWFLFDYHDNETKHTLARIS